MGLALIIVFGGYQLVANLPASHGASSFCFYTGRRGSVFTIGSSRIRSRVSFRTDICRCVGSCGIGILVSANISGVRREGPIPNTYPGSPNTT